MLNKKIHEHGMKVAEAAYWHTSNQGLGSPLHVAVM